MLDFSDNSHRRLNILTGEWILVSPHRTKRPWQGKTEKPAMNNRPSYDATCYLCPGNSRAGGIKNPAYTDTYVFDNDFGALQPNHPKDNYENGLLKAKGEPGICRVICFSPDHSLTLPDMSMDAINNVVKTWQEQYIELGSREDINHVQIFENKGDIMGCSNPHPHGQIWAQYSIPGEAQKKCDRQLEYYQKNNSGLLQTYVDQELALNERIIFQNDHMIALVPFWATWPYEAMIIPRRKVASIDKFTVEERFAFAASLKNLTQRFDRIFDTSFPYSSGIHQAPTDGKSHPEWHLHMSFYPPLLRSATVKKFMVGYEMFADPQRDITPEMAAQQLRELG